LREGQARLSLKGQNGPFAAALAEINMRRARNSGLLLHVDLSNSQPECLPCSRK
jgi:hypothetical protein